jgi:uncharacterized protein YrrD
MLVLSKMLLQRPVMSLRTSTQVAIATQAIINPNNLRIEGFFCIDSLERHKQLILLHKDIRDVLTAGLVINDHADLTDPHDLIRLKKIINLHFEIVGKKIRTQSKKRLGKVIDYAVDPESMMIKKIYASQSLFKSLVGGTLSIDRNQIIEITNKEIIVKDTAVRVEQTVPVLNAQPAS